MINEFKLSKARVQVAGIKPRGKWYSLYNSWNSFEEISCGNHVHKIKFVPKVHVLWRNASLSGEVNCDYKNKILVIRSFKDLRKFIAKYGAKRYGILWKKVAKHWGGIEFRRFHKIAKILHKKNLVLTNAYSWFTSLDSSSGCVWNYKLIHTIKYAFDNNMIA